MADFLAQDFDNAGVAKLADAPDLGSGAARRVGSSPITRTDLPDMGGFFIGLFLLPVQTIAR